MFDISKWDMRLSRDPVQRYSVLRVPDPKRGEVTIEETAAYDAAEQVRHVVWYLSTPEQRDFRAIEYDLRVIFPQELLLLLEAGGLRLEARYGEFTLHPFDSSSVRQVCVCSRTADGAD